MKLVKITITLSVPDDTPIKDVGVMSRAYRTSHLPEALLTVVNDKVDANQKLRAVDVRVKERGKVLVTTQYFNCGGGPK